MYVCTYVRKDITEDNYEKGCSLTSKCVLSEAILLTSGTLKGMIEEIKKRFGLKMDELFMPEDDSSYIGFNRLEKAGKEPTEEDLEEWRKGNLQLFLADYTFSVEKRESIRRIEYEEIGIPTY